MESLHRVVDLVHDRLGDQLRVADLAAAADCSAQALERRMKKVFGVTATQFVLRTRVDVATRLLTTTETPLAEVATAVGFYDQADFTRRFARLTNETPAQFRRSHSER
jgi:transcriptional regulator GlxA family with amidase domain